MGVDLEQGARSITSPKLITDMPTKKTATKKASVKKPVKKATAKKKVSRAAVKNTCACSETCRPGESFWVNYGPVVDSIASLREAIKTMSEEQYRYHTTRGTNDFASWIRNCFRNEAVANRVEKAGTQAKAVKALSECCS